MRGCGTRCHQIVRNVICYTYTVIIRSADTAFPVPMIIPTFVGSIINQFNFNTTVIFQAWSSCSKTVKITQIRIIDKWISRTFDQYTALKCSFILVHPYNSNYIKLVSGNVIRATKRGYNRHQLVQWF